MNADVDKQVKAQKDEDMDKEIEDFLEHALGSEFDDEKDGWI